MNKTLFIGLHGGSQTSEKEAWINYLDFRKMSKLEELEAPDFHVWLPQAPRRVWGLYFGKDMRDVNMLRDGISKFEAENGPSTVLAGALSEGACALYHYCRYIRFDGIICCSGLMDPFVWVREKLATLTGLPDYVPTDSLFWAGSQERQKNRDAAWEMSEGFSHWPGHVTTVEMYDGHHRWPSEWNYKIKRRFAR